jgi:hypothetical protein
MDNIKKELFETKEMVKTLTTQLDNLYDTRIHYKKDIKNANRDAILEKYNISDLLDSGFKIRGNVGITLEGRGVRMDLDYQTWSDGEEKEFNPKLCVFNFSNVGYGIRSDANDTKDTLLADCKQPQEMAEDIIKFNQWFASIDYIQLMEELYNSNIAIDERPDVKDYLTAEITDLHAQKAELIDSAASRIYSSIVPDDDLSILIAPISKNGSSSTVLFDTITKQGNFRVVHKFETHPEVKQSFTPDHIIDLIKCYIR